MHVLVIGKTDVGRRACALLKQRGLQVKHLDEPTDAEIHAQLISGANAVAVLLHDDIRALRYSLMVEHIRPGIRLFVAIFDRTVRSQLEAAVPNIVVMSPAAIAAPSMVAAAITPEYSAVRRKSGPHLRKWVSIRPESDKFKVTDCSVPFGLKLKGLRGKALGQARPYDRGSGVLLTGAIGLAAITGIDTLLALSHEDLVTSLYDAMLTTATIITPHIDHDPARQIWAIGAAFAVMGFTAAFGAGIVHHLLEGGHVGLIGRRVAPRSGHVIVAGMGQVGIRLAQELKELGVAVVCLEQKADAPTLNLAKTLRIPVIIGNASSRSVLVNAGIKRALALVTAGSDERDNIAIAISARAIAPNLNVVLRAGSDDAIDETRSLFRIGSAVDVNALTAAYVVQAVATQRPYLTLHDQQRIVAIDDHGDVLGQFADVTHWCEC
jgi:Trk K+ transport system NAD-binding subunit